VVGPVQGFGKMWQKTMRVELRGANVPPAQVISTVWTLGTPVRWLRRPAAGRPTGDA
jgi:hypothetical protein